MRRRKLLIGLMSAGAFTAGFSAAVFPASAQLRTITVTLLGGETVTVQVDTPPDAATTGTDALPAASTSTSDASATTDAPPPHRRRRHRTPAPSSSPTPAPPAATPDPSRRHAGPAPAATDPAARTGPERRHARRHGDRQRPRPRRERALRLGWWPAGPGDGRQGAPQGNRRGRRQVQVRRQARRDGDPPLRRRPDLGQPHLLRQGLPGAAAIGVPNFFIDKFRIPPFLLPIYQAAGIEYGIRWEVLAGINEIETDYGRNLNVSSAGALGWMQFMPATWKQYGVDANHDGKKDPFNPVDAIFAAARYLKAAGADSDIRQAIFAYNHADWYVDSVLMRARLIGGTPADLVGSLTGLTQGHFPVSAKATYADDLSERQINAKIARGRNAAMPIEANTSRRGINIYAKAGSAAIATQDGRVVKIGKTKRLGQFIQIQDVYGNTYTYAQLKKVAVAYAVPKAEKVSKAQVAKELGLPKKDPKPTQAASAGSQPKAASRQEERHAGPPPRTPPARRSPSSAPRGST